MMNNPTSPDGPFPSFSLERLLRTVFEPRGGERVAILIDLEEPGQMEGYAFLEDPSNSVQKYAYDVFYEGLRHGDAASLGLKGGDMFAYLVTGGSNLDLPDEAVDAAGRVLSLSQDIYPSYDLILCVSTYSATAPLTAHAKRFGFRGATLHGLNRVILDSGLAVDYDEVSEQAETMRLAMTKADWIEIDFVVAGREASLHIDLEGQEAQKSHGLCRGPGPDIANLPAGEIYYVPEGAHGTFPMRYEDGTLGLMKVRDGRIHEAEFLAGDAAVVVAHNAKLAADPVTGELGELGFGTQVLPVSGRDIQDEKVLGTMHVATGRSDHLGGKLTPDLFKEARNATHDDILFSPTKTPEIRVPQVRMHKNGETVVLIEDFRPSAWLRPHTQLAKAPADTLSAVP